MTAADGHVERPMRVASVVKRLHVGGDEKRLLTLARSFDRDVVDHVVVVVNPTDEERDARIGAMLDQYLAAGVDVVVLRDELLAPGRRGGPAQIAAAVSVLRRLTTLLRSRGIDVVDARLEFGAAFGLLAGRLARVPVVVATGYSPAYWSSTVRWPIGQAVFASLDALVTDAGPSAEAYARWRLSRHARLAVIPNGIPPALPERPRAEVRRLLGLPVDAPVVAQVARMLPHKGYETLLRAARLVIDRRPDVGFLLCGFAEDPAYRDRLLRLASSLGLDGRAVVTSYQGPVGDVLGAVDVFAHLSSFDSSPIAIHESMSAGLPAVVSRVGGTPDLVVDGVTGCLVPALDPPAAAAALVRLLDDPGLAGRLGAAARERYGERHQPESMAAAHARLYTELLAARAARRPR